MHKEKEQYKVNSDSIKASSAGFALIGSIFAFAAIGYLIDSEVSAFPIFSVIGLISGIAGGFYLVFKISSEILNK